jgi:hypothetical protein
MGKGLALNAAYPAAIPLLFLDGTYSTTIASIWPAATNGMAADSDYETAGPQVFRFEYYYLLKSANGYTVVDPTSVPPNLPTTVLSSGIGTYTVSVNGTPTSVSLWSSGTNSFVVQDVAAIVVAIAVIEPKSRVLLSTANMEKLAGANGQTSPLIDFTNGWVPGQLLSTWQTALDGITDMPRPAISGIRLYERYFYLYQ